MDARGAELPVRFVADTAGPDEVKEHGGRGKGHHIFRVTRLTIALTL